ncbi:MAG: hypothetical protein EZS28_011369 [Streblomastix strix]|uniref:Uncharacterized protein n=1 Tax=Streblomastix strix TaxID=222440 RepID=A0A5J4WFB2_9EUKA|nr:MAG: hypothetical protein EZS28_011369 [Streblomastix strix]
MLHCLSFQNFFGLLRYDQIPTVEHITPFLTLQAPKAEPSAFDRDFETSSQTKVSPNLDCSIGFVFRSSCSSLHFLSNTSCNHLLVALTKPGLTLILSISVPCTSFFCRFLSDSLSDSYIGDLDLSLNLDLKQDLDLYLCQEFNLLRKQDQGLPCRFLCQL